MLADRRLMLTEISGGNPWRIQGAHHGKIFTGSQPAAQAAAGVIIHN